jgi:hypothetical protein
MSGDDDDDDGGEVKEEKGGRGVHLRDNRGWSVIIFIFRKICT